MLSVRIRRRLTQFDLEVDVCCPYAATAVFGPSGAGKTSLLNAVAGLLKPDEGEIVLDGETLFDSAAGIDLAPEARHLGVVLQDDLLFPHLSVDDNLRYGYRLLPRAVRRLDPGRVVELLEIGSLLGRRPAHLSGGERQRVALGRALLSSPRMLLMDEPLASLDQGLKSRIIPYLRHIRSDLGIPILYVSHSVAEILELTGQVIVLETGRVLAHGDFFRIAHLPSVLPLVEERGLENVLQAEVIAADAVAGFCRVRCCGHEWKTPFCDRPVGTRVFICIRAEDIVLGRQAPPGLSVRNVIPGRVLEVSRSRQTTLVYVDVGVRIAVKMTPEAADELHLRPGEEVVCLVKTHAIRMGPDTA